MYSRSLNAFRGWTKSWSGAIVVCKTLLMLSSSIQRASAKAHEDLAQGQLTLNVCPPLAGFKCATNWKGCVRGCSARLILPFDTVLQSLLLCHALQTSRAAACTRAACDLPENLHHVADCGHLSAHPFLMRSPSPKCNDFRLDHPDACQNRFHEGCKCCPSKECGHRIGATST